MGDLGSTYGKHYTPTHIARDFQAICFGTPSKEELIRSVPSMGLSRDRRALTELDDDQQKQVRNDPVLVAFREKREKYKKMLKDKGFYLLTAGKGTRLYNKYERKKQELASTYQQLHRI
jgi:predicted double-glycine peptidase